MVVNYVVRYNARSRFYSCEIEFLKKLSINSLVVKFSLVKYITYNCTFSIWQLCMNKTNTSAHSVSAESKLNWCMNKKRNEGVPSRHRPVNKPINACFSFSFFRTVSKFRCFHELFRSFMGREPTYRPERKQFH